MPRLLQQPAEDIQYELEQDSLNLLVRDPHCLYVYWDISENRKNMLKNELGAEFYGKSVPALKITNVSINESFYVRINEFSTSWYVNVQDSGSIYIAEIGRKLSDSFFVSVLNSNSIYTPAETASNNTTAYFADYTHVRQGKYDFVINRKSMNRFEDLSHSGILGTSSVEFTGDFRQNNPFGLSSYEFYRNLQVKG